MNRRVVAADCAKVGFGPCQLHPTVVRPLSDSQLRPRNLDAWIQMGDSRREDCKPLPPTEVEVLAIVAGYSPESFFQDAAGIVTYIRSRYHLAGIKVGY